MFKLKKVSEKTGATISRGVWGGDFHMKGAGMLVGNFELNP